MKQNNWRWQEGHVDTAREHIKIYYGNYTSDITLVAFVAPAANKCFAVQFLVKSGDKIVDIDKILADTKKELDHYLTELDVPDPWQNAIDHSTTTADQYSNVHWRHYPDKRNGG